ncbi:MAG: transglutaminase TgpA family protein [Wenzhouxiangella sp.]
MAGPLPFNAVAWTIAAFLIAALPHLAAMPPWLAAVIVGACLWRLAIARSEGSRPPAVLRLLLTGAAVALIVVAFGGLWGRRTATALLCVMLAAKMMEMFSVRDLRLVASVSFFLIATQFLFSERLVYLGYLLVGSLTATVALVRIQDFHGRPAGEASGDQVSAIRNAAALLLMALPVALTLFVLFPRLAQPLWGLPEQVMDGRTGLSEDMSPGSISNLFLDDSPAFRVEFAGPPPPADERYWRGPVLWNFDGTTWTRPFFGDTPRRQFVPEGERTRRYSVQLEPHEQRWLFALDYPIAAPDNATVTVDHQLLKRHPITALTRYELVSNPDFVDAPRLAEGARSVALRLPDGRNPQTLALAEELRRRHPEDRALIAAVLRWFREEEFFYTLSAAPLGRHGADEFLFDLRAGYCEYYASAFAVLMRAAGIPSRIVTGYQGGLWQDGSDYLLVRQSDAHAWTEVWLPDAGWTRIDPTAAVSPERIEQGARSVIDRPGGVLSLDWLEPIRNRYDRIQHLWNRWVLGFDHERQHDFLDRLGLPGLSPERIALLMLMALLLVSAPIGYFLLRQSRPRRSSPVERAWHRILARLRRLNLAKQAAETPLEFAQRIESTLPVSGTRFRRLAEMYCRIHYGDHDAEDAIFLQQARRFSPRRPLNRSPSDRSK